MIEIRPRSASKAAGVSTDRDTSSTASAIEPSIPDLPAGGYYLFVRADDQNSLWEGNESNNQMSAPVTLRRLAP